MISATERGGNIEIPSVLKAKEVTENSISRYITQNGWGPKHMLDWYKQRVRETATKRRKLKHPVNKHTGKPLKASTLKTYRSSLPSDERELKVMKGKIQLLIYHGHMGSPKTRERWALEGLSGDERLFVRAFNGSATATARELYSGNYMKIRQAGQNIMKNPAVGRGIYMLRLQRISGLKKIRGGGQTTKSWVVVEKNTAGIIKIRGPFPEDCIPVSDVDALRREANRLVKWLISIPLKQVRF